MGGIRITWRPRATPLAPSGVAALGSSARALARRLLADTDESLARLRGVSGPGVLVVLGEASSLPWADGVVYLGADARARSLLLPTALEFVEPAELVDRALAARFGADAGAPFALLGDAEIVVSLAAARPVSRGALERWLAGDD